MQPLPMVQRRQKVICISKPVKDKYLLPEGPYKSGTSNGDMLGTSLPINLTQYNKNVGLYRARLGGRIVYIGKAIEWNNGGFRKRLSDYTRESSSARKHGSGQKMYAHRNELVIELLIVGGDAKAAEITPKLEALMIGKYNPEWNKVRNFNI